MDDNNKNIPEDESFEENENERVEPNDSLDEEDNEKRMTREEYEALEQSDELLSNFLSEEPSPANEITMIMIPNYRINEELVIKSYVELICKQRTRSAIEILVAQVWDKAVVYGAYCERLEKLQADVEQMNFEESILRGEFEIIETGEEFDDEK